MEAFVASSDGRAEASSSAWSSERIYTGLMIDGCERKSTNQNSNVSGCMFQAPIVVALQN